MTQNKIKELFEYRDGKLYWVVSLYRQPCIGKIAGTKNGNGYMQVRVNGKIVLQHRVIFLYHHGYLPKFIDHIDHDRTNNRIENLRPATPRENQSNRRVGKNNTSGFTGVSWDRINKKFEATSRLNGKKINLGRYATAKEASEVYIAWNRSHFFKESA